MNTETEIRKMLEYKVGRLLYHINEDDYREAWKYGYMICSMLFYAIWVRNEKQPEDLGL